MQLSSTHLHVAVSHHTSPHTRPDELAVEPPALLLCCCACDVSAGCQVGSYSALFVRLLMALSAPISWPIGKLLDWLLGSEHSVGDEPCFRLSSAALFG